MASHKTDEEMIVIRSIPDLSVEVIPQAILNLPIGNVVGRHGKVTSGVDDLDKFEGASFELNGKVEIAVRHYAGYPQNTSTIYIDRRIQDLGEITQLIRVILREFRISEASLEWERADNPDY
ncbi:hypothetical protein [Tardiphaga sp.]|jgi:hypothetical protein|uniref:hypothetical protein n=1 Tax=Tardiphaga sp. TaxID=1926292 RepID=UPI0037DA2901